MSSAAQNLTRQAVERAEPLSFPTKRSAVVHVTYRGVPVDVSLEGANVAEVEKLISSLLERDGWSGAARELVSGAARKRPTLPEALYQPDGTPCCPWHQRPLKEGRYGLYCASKAEGEHANDKGYCIFTMRQ
jgi:hypothetical protein